MQILADYHTHTVYSHGKGTIEENVKIAIQKGIKTIGISDHSYGHAIFGVKRDELFKMRAEINDLNEIYGDKIKILLGVECNILDKHGNIDCDDKIRKILDYVMAGYHFGSTPTNISGWKNHFDNLLFHSKKAAEYNTEAICNAMKNNDIFAITHPGDKGDVYIEEIAKVAKDTNTHLEINSSHNFLNIEQLITIKDIGNTFIIGSDAHTPNDVGRFLPAIYTMKYSGLPLSRIENVRF